MQRSKIEIFFIIIFEYIGFGECLVILELMISPTSDNYSSLGQYLIGIVLHYIVQFQIQIFSFGHFFFCFTDIHPITRAPSVHIHIFGYRIYMMISCSFEGFLSPATATRQQYNTDVSPMRAVRQES